MAFFMPQTTAQTFEADILQALSRCGIDPEVLSAEEAEIARRYFSQKERDSMPESSFCGPGKSFPITSQADVNNAARLIGHADNPDAVKACIKRKAKANGWSIPDAWKSDSDSDSSDDGDRLASPVLIRADGSHDPMTGTHSHAHKAFGASGGDDLHAHKHSHNDDANHDHSHAKADDSDGDGDEERAAEPVERVTMPEHPHLYLPITRIDNDKWEVEGVATSEAVDTYGTVFSYEASKAAFQKWVNRTANVREMHQKMAVGKGIGVFFDDANRQVIVRSRVSKGAKDTWLKVQEGVLTGYSVGAINPVWETVERNGKTYPYLTSYDLTELSLVDNPSNPDSFQLSICRADGLTDVIEVEVEQPTGSIVQPTPEAVERKGARISADTRAQLHSTIDSLKKTCGCDECMGETDGDGDKDEDDGERVAKMTEELLKSTVEKVIERVLSPIYSRQQQFLARLAQAQPEEPEPLAAQPDQITPLVAQVTTLQTTVERMAQSLEKSSFLDEVRAELSAVKGQVERIAAQPMPGGPVMNGAPMPRPVANKMLATDNSAPTMQPRDMSAVLDLLQEKGILDTLDKQVQAASLMVQPMRGRVGG
jgi:hypothetical protein